MGGGNQGGGVQTLPNPHEPTVTGTDNPNPAPENKSDPKSVEDTIRRGIEDQALNILDPEKDSAGSLLGN